MYHKYSALGIPLRSPLIWINDQCCCISLYLCDPIETPSCKYFNTQQMVRRCSVTDAHFSPIILILLVQLWRAERLLSVQHAVGYISLTVLDGHCWSCIMVTSCHLFSPNAQLLDSDQYIQQSHVGRQCFYELISKLFILFVYTPLLVWSCDKPVLAALSAPLSLNTDNMLELWFTRVALLNNLCLCLHFYFLIWFWHWLLDAAEVQGWWDVFCIVYVCVCLCVRDRLGLMSSKLLHPSPADVHFYFDHKRAHRLTLNH